MFISLEKNNIHMCHCIGLSCLQEPIVDCAQVEASARLKLVSYIIIMNVQL